MKSGRYFFLLILMVLCSCSDDNRTNTAEQRHSSEIVSIASSKKMVKIEAGDYKSFVGKDSGQIIKVESFMLDDSPVTNAEYLEFVKQNPKWRKSNVLRLYADSTYLKFWKNDLEIPKSKSDAPVTNISWYAAETYAKSVGKRLPTIDEWEYVAAADENSRNATGKPEFTKYILNSYQSMSRNSAVKQKNPNFYGVYDMYGLAWEWTDDFNSVMMSGESRKDTSADESLFCAGAAVTSLELRNYAALMRYALRGSLKARNCLNNLGFRCAKDLK